jgi:hypothetical protein
MHNTNQNEPAIGLHAESIESGPRFVQILNMILILSSVLRHLYQFLSFGDVSFSYTQNLNGTCLKSLIHTGIEVV